jgi:uncharacterized protein YcbK (DUF882 family)
MDWNKYPSFKKREFDCKHTGKNLMRPEFMETLQQIRNTYGRPLIVSSGYRDPSHPVEAKKEAPGEHTYGVAADILIRGENAMDLIVIAYGYGIRRIGVHQKGDDRFIHLGMGDKGLGFPATIWTY